MRLRSSGILRGVEWTLLTDVSGKHIGSIIKGQAVRDCYLEDGIYRSPDTSVNR